MRRPFTVACVQTTSGRDIAANVATASKWVRAARKAGADFILLPETVNIMEPKGALLLDKVAADGGDAGLRAFRALARDVGAWLLAGSLVVPADKTGTRRGAAKAAKRMVANRSLLIDPRGSVKARYDKIHMFDVDLGKGEVYRESKRYAAGAKAVTAKLPWGRLGMTVCYDLRFPHLYRALAQRGADFLSVPSAFTRPSGSAHWHVLLRARAIENGCFVFAPAQCCVHEGGRRTFGHSLIVDPWGAVLADGGDAPGFVAATVEPERVVEARKRIPSLDHDRKFKF